MPVHLLISAVALTLAAPAAAPSNDIVWPVCANEGGQRAIPDRIAACTAIIGSGRESPQSLANAYFSRGNAHVDQNEFARAETDYSEAIRLYPRAAGPHHNRGLTYTRRGDYRSAIADYDEAIRLDPELSEAFNNRCMMRAMYLTAEFDLARADCNAAIRLGGDGPRFLTSRGFLNLRQGRLQDAWNDYDAAVRGRPDYADALYGRGIAALRLDRIPQGLADIARATALDDTIAGAFAGDWITP